MNVLLIIHNIAAVVSAVVAVAVAFFLFLNGRKAAANITFALVFLGAALFYISHVIGVNITDSELSRWVLMGNVVIFFIGVFNYHAVLAVVNKDKEHHIFLSSLYACAGALAIFFFIFPDLLLLPSIPKMYFPNYYEPGVLNWVRILFLYIILVPASLYTLYVEYSRAASLSNKKQLKYFMLTMIFGYGVALIPNFLIYNIPIDPLWGIFFVVVCTVPLVYGAIKYELFNVQVIAKQAFLYSLAVAAVGGVITALNYTNLLITTSYPGFPTWTLALVSAVLAVSLSVIVWRGLRKSDLMKAEFITTVTHKFRTPLTYIKWATETLGNPNLSIEERKTQLNYIQVANEKLVELTNILTTASDAESSEYGYNLKPSDISHTAQEVVESVEDQLKIKHLKIVRNFTPNLIARYDDARIKFVIQVFLENALHYSSPEGVITVTTEEKGRDVVLSVTDTGLGMTEEQISLLFSKFYRSDEARKLDTEGMGMGLFISARIVEKHNGRIWAESEGPGKGSTFFIALPRVK